MRIYLDNCCLNRPFDNQTQKKIQIEAEEPFDYTKWQSDLCVDKAVKEISEEAMEYRTFKK